MKKLHVQLVLLLAMLVSVGCYKITYKLDDSLKVEDISKPKEGGKVEEGAEQDYRTERWNHYFFFGLIPVNERYELSSFCPDRRPVVVNTSMKPTNVLATILSLDLNTASTIEVRCLKEKEKEAPASSTFSEIKKKFGLPF